MSRSCVDMPNIEMMMEIIGLDLTQLPRDVRDKLAELELELSEGESIDLCIEIN